MRLTRYTDYAFRVLIHVGQQGDRASTIQEIADFHQISRNHLMKVVQHLGQLGYLHTTRGRGGGLQLGCPPQQINLGQLVRQTEEDMTLVECFDPTSNRCAIASHCRLKGILHQGLRAWLQVLDGYTLADLIGQPGLAQNFGEAAKLKRS